MKGRIIPSSFVISMFFAGGALLYAGSIDVSLSSLLLGMLLSALILSASVPAAVEVFSSASVSSTSGKGRRFLLVILAPMTALAALWAALSVSREFSDFASDVMLLRLPSVLISLLFLLFCSFFASKGIEVMRKLAFYGLPLLIFGALLLLIYSIPSFRAEVFTIDLGTPDVNDLLWVSARLFLPLALPSVLLCTGRRVRATPLGVILGLLIGVILLLICQLNVTLLFGDTLSESLERPYPEAVRTITAGKLFLRLEGVFYAMYFAAASFRCALCIALTVSMTGKLFPRLSKMFLSFFFGGAVYLLLIFSALG